MDRPSLIVIDMQNGFINRRSEHVVSPIREFINEWSSQGGRVLATRFNNPEGSQWERLIHWKRLRETPEKDIEENIATALANSPDSLVIDKYTYSSLTPEAQGYLEMAPAEPIYICGIATDSCVLKTAVDLFENGQTPIVISDLVASHAGEEAHRAGLFLIGRFIGTEQIQSSDTVLNNL